MWWCFLVLAACLPAVQADFPSGACGPLPVRTLCVLPFTNHTEEASLGERVRRSAYGHLSVKRFRDVELSFIDAALKALPGDWQTLSPQALGRYLGCDGLVYGEVVEAGRVYLGIYSRLSLGGRLRLVGAKDGRLLARASYTTNLYAGGVPLSPLGIIPTSLLTFRNVLDGQMEKAIDDLGRKLAARIPEPQDAYPPVSKRWPEGSYRLQIAPFWSSAEAERVAQRLQRKGYRPSIVPVRGMGKTWHRIWLGPFSTLGEAQKARSQIRKKLGFYPLLVQVVD